MHPLAFRQRLRDLVEPTVNRLGFDVVAVELLGSGTGRIVRLSIDKPGGVGADDCAEVTIHLGPVLDEADPIQGSYTLEVSSPGISRPVQRRDDFARFAGYRAKIRLFEGPPRRRYTGTLAGVDEDDVRIVCDGEEHRLPLDQIERARLVLDLDEYQRLGEGLPELPEGESDDQ